MQSFKISLDQSGQRVDKYVRRILKDVPLGVVYRLIRDKTIRVNQARTEISYLLQEGDEVLFRVDPEVILARQPGTPARHTPTHGGHAEAPLPPKLQGLVVLYEDDHVMAINKPSGMAVHPGSGITEGTVVDEVRAYLGNRAVRNEFAASPAHRIDRETSGVLLIAKTRRAMVRFTEIFTEGTAKKLYVTVAKGRFTKPEGLIDIPLQEHQQTGKSKAEHGIKMQLALTRYKVQSYSNEASLLACTIETGRTHQIRRHLAAIGHPVCGDKKHGDFPLNRTLKTKWGLKRMFLHAFKIELEHPIHGGNLKVEAPLPEELRAALKRANLQMPDKLSPPTPSGK